MGFKSIVNADLHRIFLNNNEFAEPRTLIIDGKRFSGVSVVLTGAKEQDKRRLASVQGLFVANIVLHCALADIGGIQPEPKQIIKISDSGNSNFFRSYRVVASALDMGMLRAELPAVTE